MRPPSIFLPQLVNLGHRPVLRTGRALRCGCSREPGASSDGSAPRLCLKKAPGLRRAGTSRESFLAPSTNPVLTEQRPGFPSEATTGTHNRQISHKPHLSWLGNGLPCPRFSQRFFRKKPSPPFSGRAQGGRSSLPGCTTGRGQWDPMSGHRWPPGPANESWSSPRRQCQGRRRVPSPAFKD